MTERTRTRMTSVGLAISIGLADCGGEGVLRSATLGGSSGPSAETSR
jgi:hypothetical protein